MARHIAGSLMDVVHETFSGIYANANQGTSWLSVPAFSDLVSGDAFKTSDLAKREIEQEMAAMLKDLPLSITITKQGDLYSDEYTWQCMGITGKADSVVDATREALQSLIKAYAVSQAN